MIDRIETLGHSRFQHGASNQRVYLMKAADEDLDQLLPHLDELAREHGYTKIFAKVSARQKEFFLARGYQLEAVVPDFYRRRDQALFLGKYFSKSRAAEKRPELVEDVLDKAKLKKGLVAAVKAPSYSCRELESEDLDEAAALYAQIFTSYPFPISDPDYLRQSLDHVCYYGVWHDSRLVALASAEIDVAGANAEMTDFATDPEHQGMGLAGLLLGRMEMEMQKKGITTLYTIARAYSYGMNITFARSGYIFSGTLPNNTQIAGGLETMNVWYRQLSVRSLYR